MNKDDPNKKDQILKIFGGFPESFMADLLDKKSGSGFKRGKDTPGKFLKEKLIEPEFAANFMKLFEDYAKDEWIKDLVQDKPKYLKKLLGLPEAEADVDTNYVKSVIQEKLNQPPNRVKAFISSFESFAENGTMHIFFYKIAGTEQLKDLQTKIEKLDDQISKIAKRKSLQAKIKKLEDLKSQRKTLKDLQLKIDKFEYLKSEIKKLKDLQSKIEKLEDQKSKTKRLEALQAKIKKLENEKSEIKDLKDLRANIDNLLKSKLDKFLWGAGHPELVSVESRKYNSRNEVWFKWVESRLWNERKTDLKVSPTPYYVRRMERSVSYFIVDLENKIAQLSIQLIRPNALKSLKEEYKHFRTEIDKLLGFFHFSRLPMEAVVKKFLSLNKIKPLTWEMQIPDGAYFSVKGKSEFFFSTLRKIPLLKYLDKDVIKRIIFFGRKLSCEFNSKKREWGSPEVRIKLDGEKDVLTFMSECEHKQMKTIIDNVLAVDKNKVLDDNLKKFLKNKKSLNNLSSAERFLFERIVLSFDYHFTRLEDSEIKEGHLEDNEWLPKKIVGIAVDRLCQEYPGNFIPKGTRSNRVLEKIK